MIGCTAIAAVLVSSGATAQERTNDDPGLSDIITVTAQKREQKLQDVGVSITAFSGENLKDLGFTTSTDLVQQTPGLQLISPNGGSSNFFSLRGVTQNDFTDHQESPIATYVDEVYVSQSAGTAFQLFDLDRVEVLRGPQGTLFGRNATGGLVHFLTQRPTDSLDGYLTVGGGSYKQFRAEGAMGGPIAHHVSLRLSAATNHHSGWLKNRLGPDFNNGDDTSGRAQLLLEPKDDLNILLNLRGSRQNIRAGTYSHATGVLGQDGLGQFVKPDENPYGTCMGCDLNGYVDSDGDIHTGDYNTPGFNHVKAWGSTGTINWKKGDIGLTSITDYSHLRKNYLEDSDASPANFLTFGLSSDVSQLSQELRLNGDHGSVRWVAGLFYLNIDGNYFSQLALPLNDVALNNSYQQRSKSFALYGQGEYDLTRNLTFIAGLRWSQDRKRISYHSAATDNQGADLGTILDFNPSITPIARDKTSDWSGRMQLNYKPNNDLLLYGSWNRGLKGGGYNAPLDVSGIFDPISGQPNLARMKFGSEVLYSYEAGIKYTLPDRIGSFNAAAFHYDYHGYQAFDLQGLTQFVFNTPARINGIDAELSLRPALGLNVSAGLSLLDAKARNIPLPNGSKATRDIVLAPDVTLNGMVRYEWAALKGYLSAQIDGRYISSHYFNISNAPTTYEGSYGVANLRFGYTTDDGKVQISAFAKNVTKTKYRVIAFDVSSLGLVENYPGMPRWFGIELTYSIR
tara:strand:+ start:1357 stop:3573 length:2217 start_codon:yes stop_codon:yes gene_type:complete